MMKITAMATRTVTGLAARVPDPHCDVRNPAKKRNSAMRRSIGNVLRSVRTLHF